MMKAGREPAANGTSYDALVAAVTSIEREALSAPTPTLMTPAWVLSGSTTRSGWLTLQSRQTPTSGPSMAVAPSSVVSGRSEEHTSELQSLMRISYAVFCLKTKILTKQMFISIILRNKSQLISIHNQKI